MTKVNLKRLNELLEKAKQRSNQKVIKETQERQTKEHSSSQHKEKIENKLYLNHNAETVIVYTNANRTDSHSLPR